MPKSNRPNLIISVAMENDAEELARLVNSAYRGPSSRVSWTTEADFLDGQRTDAQMLLENIRTPGCSILCLRFKIGAEIQGCVFLERNEDSCCLGMLTLKPTLQGEGLGSLLLQKAEEYIRAQGVKRVILQVIHLRDTLMAWYEQRGYRRTGEIEPFPYGNPRFGIPLRDDLHFINFEKILE